MFNTGYPVGTSISPYEMTQTEDERFEITLPVPGNLYYYDYVVTYDDGSTVTIKDPANMPIANETNGHDAGHSLVYVGNAENTTAGQEYIYARKDTAKGSYRFVTYKAVDGTDQPLGTRSRVQQIMMRARLIKPFMYLMVAADRRTNG